MKHFGPRLQLYRNLIVFLSGDRGPRLWCKKIIHQCAHESLFLTNRRVLVIEINESPSQDYEMGGS